MVEVDCVPTELDSDSDITVVVSSDNDDKDEHNYKDNETSKDAEVPQSLGPFWHWNHMQRKINKCMLVSAREHNISFRLCHPDEAIDHHVAYVLNDILSSARYRDHAFKFGISADPANRFTSFVDYRFLDLMVLVYTAEDSDFTAKYEEQCITKYRGDSRLQNRKPGGENAHCGCSPHFLYVVFGKPRQFEYGRRLSLR